MIRISILFSAVLQAAAVHAQTFGNEWIDLERRHWRFDVFGTGIHRVDRATLEAAGFPVTTVDPADVMLFAREKQVPIYIQGGDDGQFDTGDYIEFIGRKNDGWLDTRMYAGPLEHANPYYSQANDTIHYFLTWDSDPDVVKERVRPYANPNLNAHTVRPWVWSRSVRSFTDAYWMGYVVPVLNATSGLMVASEGWGGPPLYTEDGTVETYAPVITERPYTGPGAPPAKVDIVVAAQNKVSGDFVLCHHLQILAGIGGNTLFIDTIYSGSKVIRTSFEVPTTDLTNNFSAVLRVPHDLAGLPGAVSAPNYLDFQAPAAAAVDYARDLTINGAGPLDFRIPVDADPLARLSFVNFTGTPVLYTTGDTIRRILPVNSGGSWQALVPTHPDSVNVSAFLASAETATNVNSLEMVNGTGFFTDYATLDLDSAFLIVTHRSLWSAATAYADYRSGPAPDPRPSIVADVDELYDQFGGGIPKHPIAIRSWCRYLLNEWTTDPQGLLLIGKSVVTSTTVYGQGYRPDGAGAYARTLVPSFGYPACDQCITIGIGAFGDPRRVEIPVGRLSASSEDQVLDYLAKVQEFEGQDPAPWMKNFVHLSGGFTENEQMQLSLALSTMAQRVNENTAMDAQVTRFRKNSSDVFSTAAADSVRQLIEGGTTMLNFFAHAYAESFDITIDDPSQYEWNGRYPMVFGNSCYIGNVHLNEDLYSTSEDWVIRPQEGPIAFLASTEQAEVSLLTGYGIELYNSIGSVNYGGTVGDHMQHAAFTYLSQSFTEPAMHTVHTFTLQGDPLLVLNSPRLPDFSVDAAEVYFDPPTVTADLDSFTVKVVVRNLGRAVPEQVRVQLERSNTSLPAQPALVEALNGVGAIDTAYFRVPALGTVGGQGMNQFTIRVDLDPDLIAELSPEFGPNQTSTTLFITSGDLVPIYPYDYAIVPDPTPQLKASTGDPLAPLRTYVFQIDTTDLFNSPLLEAASISSTGGVITWQPTTVYGINSVMDSTVFYWRCSIDSTGNGGYNWDERSFQYLTGRRGWGQAHYFQFKEDDYNSVIYDRPGRDFDFSTAPHQVSAWTPGFDYLGDIGWRLDLTSQDYGICAAEASWHVAVIDPYTFQPWGTKWTDNSQDPPVVYNADRNYGNQNNDGGCRQRVMNIFTYRQNIPQQMTALHDLLANEIPEGHHVLMYTALYMDQNGMASEPALRSYMEDELGVPAFNTLQDSVPYIFYVRKGDTSTFRDTIGIDINSDISLSTEIASSGESGFITSTPVGPAVQWQKLYWNELPYDENDSTRIKLIGVDLGGQEVDIAEFPSEQDSVENLWSYVDAQYYPGLKLQAKVHDFNATEPKPTYLERWQVLHQPAPECAIDPQLGYYQGLDGHFQGQEAAIAVAVHNISEFDMDSLLIAAYVINAANDQRIVHYRRSAPLLAGSFVLDTIRFSTLGFGGSNTLIVEANPIDTVTGLYDQLEQYHFNNIAQWRFDVTMDQENPLLDVTFDGRHILDGDIVSAEPEVLISLDDENTVLLLDSPADTAQFKVFLTRPGAAIERVYFRDGAGNEVLQFIPADGPDNEARIHYRPRFPTDGKYLLTVQASDLSANASGDDNYRISFEVINRSTITEVLNYPNPFTTSTRFVFTLTGSEPPSYMKIQILTVTGKVVREVSTSELGPLHVGRNITEFAWDGTDQFGDRLARGVYLYRVITQLNGQDVELRATDAASYFTKGFGKMYLLR